MSVETWLAEARHPGTGLPHTAMTYRPMVELLELLRDHGFSTWICSGGAYASEPVNSPALGRVGTDDRCATPKSISLTTLPS